jgi:hypothetical protein
MIELTDKLIAVVVPEDAYDFLYYWGYLYYTSLKDGMERELSLFDNNQIECEIIGTITKSGEFDFDCEEYVEVLKDNSGNARMDFTINKWVYGLSVENSFISLLQSKGISLGELNNEKILILEK